MIVLHAEQGKAVVALGPELGDIAAAKHVAIHEDRPALVAHQVRNQKTSERESSGLLRVPLSPEEALSLQLRRDQGNN